MAEAAAVAQDRGCCLRRTCKEWFMHGFLTLTSLPNLIFGIQYFYDCPGIPLLPYYEIIFCLANFCKGSLDILYRLEKRKADGEGPLDSGLQIVSGLLGVVILGLTVWGAVLTWGKTSYFSAPDQCVSPVYATGFITTVITVAIIQVLGTVEVVRAIRAIRSRRHAAAQTDLLEGRIV